MRPLPWKPSAQELPGCVRQRAPPPACCNCKRAGLTATIQHLEWIALSGASGMRWLEYAYCLRLHRRINKLSPHRNKGLSDCAGELTKKEELATTELFGVAEERKMAKSLVQEPYVSSIKRMRDYRGARIFWR